MSPPGRPECFPDKAPLCNARALAADCRRRSLPRHHFHTEGTEGTEVSEAAEKVWRPSAVVASGDFVRTIAAGG